MSEDTTTDTVETPQTEETGETGETTETVETPQIQDTPPEQTHTTFTQAQVDEIVQKRIAREKEKANAHLETELAKTKTQIAEEYRIKLEELETANRVATSELEKQTFTTQITTEALTQGAQVSQIDAFTKLIETDTVKDDTGHIDPTKVKEQVEQVIKKYPGLVQSTPIGGAVATSTTDEPLSLADAIAKKMGTK